MILFSETKLAEDLRIGAVTEKEQVFYLLLVNLFIAVWTTNAVSHLFYDPGINIFDHLSDVVDLIATASMIIFSNLVNSRGNNRDFIARYVCLSVPIGIKGLILTVALAIFIGTMEVHLGKVEHGGGIPTLAAVLIVEIFLFSRYLVAFKIASGQTRK